MGIAFGLIGGLGLFLYGMRIMGDGLEKAAGEKLKRLVEVLTNNRVMGVLVGTIVTMVIQSSSATTVMVVGFVNAGIMKLTQAVGVIMGANIGTTVTAQLVSFKLTDYAPVAVGIGVAIWLFTSNKRTKNIAEILIGFGILFIGMETMSDSMKPLREFEGFKTLLASFGGGSITDTLLGILAGFGITAIIQSSSASIGILIALASQGLLPIESALPILFGDNIGTCVTAMLSSIGATKTAKRAAFIHFLFNVIGTIIFVLLLQGPVLHFVKNISPGDSARQIANAHTMFNIGNMLIQLPFAGVLVFIARKAIPETADEQDQVMGVKYLDDRILETPSIALGQTIKEVLHMGNLALDSYRKSMEAFFKADEKIAHEVFNLESAVNNLEREIAAYLVKLSNTSLSGEQHEIVDGLFNTINDIERVGDHADNLAELAIYRIENKLDFSEGALQELQLMNDRVIKSYEQAILALKTGDTNIAKRVIEREGEIDHMEKSLRASHIARLNKQQCSPGAGVIFLDVISNLERIGDHAKKIAFAVIDATQKS
ncbi:phosphate:Na+ symporter [Anaerosolibacter carboniphilus]|uniref:Phosphate:Na+ symporter n=1 Tax=Anaerosolibacter carboniphilus TaxID=1417629 RepID=A0A841KMA9_9FIRM|nr:Na/Pi cotransporter family protein [Anaerosolibacter carboniphilus]MBB6214576.1 phosphate:Na+ symporter [Anaerosolibacter carboniphilus]